MLINKTLREKIIQLVADQTKQSDGTTVNINLIHDETKLTSKLLDFGCFSFCGICNAIREEFGIEAEYNSGITEDWQSVNDIVQFVTNIILVKNRDPGISE